MTTTFHDASPPGTPACSGCPRQVTQTRLHISHLRRRSRRSRLTGIVVGCLVAAGCDGSGDTPSNKPPATPSSVHTTPPGLNSPAAAPSIVDPSALATLSGRRLIVADYERSTLSVVDIGSVREGAQAPDITARVADGALAGPDGLAICPNATLWVANYDGSTVTGSPTRGQFVERPQITLKDLPHVQTPPT
jgi:hypothetical protein